MSNDIPRGYIPPKEAIKFVDTERLSKLEVPKHKVPIIAFCGHGRAGKDTCCEILRDNFHYPFDGSISKAVTHIVSEVTGYDPQEVYEQRHTQRMWWYDFCNELRASDPTLLVRLTLQRSACISGIRDKHELIACRDQGVIDYAIWVDRDVEPDPTLTYGPEECHFFVTNYTDRLALRFYVSELMWHVIREGKKNRSRPWT